MVSDLVHRVACAHEMRVSTQKEQVEGYLGLLGGHELLLGGSGVLVIVIAEQIKIVVVGGLGGGSLGLGGLRGRGEASATAIHQRVAEGSVELVSGDHDR